MGDAAITDSLRKMTFKGFMADSEAVRLFELAKEASAHAPCLEIGSYCGRSAAYLGLGCKTNGGILFSIDHHGGSEEQQPGQEYFDPELLNPITGRVDTFPFFMEKIRQLSLEDTVVPIVTRSEVAARCWKTPLSLLFIDGSHTFDAAFKDYSSWVSHLIPNGYLVIHDIFDDPSKGGQAPRCIYRMAIDSALFEELPMTGTLGVMRRAAAGDITPESRIRWSNI